eukprot:444554-Pyramimonas_sp.AAC.1
MGVPPAVGRCDAHQTSFRHATTSWTHTLRWRSDSAAFCWVSARVPTLLDAHTVVSQPHRNYLACALSEVRRTYYSPMECS